MTNVPDDKTPVEPVADTPVVVVPVAVAPAPSITNVDAPAPVVDTEGEIAEEEEAEKPLTPAEQIDVDNGSSINNDAAPTDDPSTPEAEDAPFATSDRELRRANNMQLLLMTMGMFTMLSGVITLAVLPYTIASGVSAYINYIIVFIVLVVATLLVAVVAMRDSARIRNRNIAATRAWSKAKYGLALHNKQAHGLNKNERRIGMTRGWDKVAFDGYPEGVQIVYTPKRGYRLITTNGENDSELPRARGNRHASV